MTVGLLALTVDPAGADAGEPFNAFLSPESQLAGVDQPVEVGFVVDSTATNFNGYSVTITFDSDVLSFEGVDEGPLMTSACSNRFANPEATPDSVTYTHVLLCADETVDGPGVLSVFRFRTLAEGQSLLRITSDPDCTFFDAGVCIGRDDPDCPRTVHLGDASILVSDSPTGAGEPAATLIVGMTLTAVPNPTPGHATLRVHGGESEPGALEIFDVSGRMLYHASLRAGQVEIAWDGQRADGEPVPGGVYVVRVDRGRGAARARLAIVR